MMEQQNIFRNLIIIGDRLLIKPLRQTEKTESGLFLPPGVKEKERVHQGFVVKLGPGYVVPSFGDGEEGWHTEEKTIRYIPLQAQVGDLAIFLMEGVTEIVYRKERYYIASQSSILMLDREDGI